MLDPVLGGEPEGLTDENLQSRIRGVLLMGISNATGAIALTTGNKSELATGYTTLYGDSVGGFAVIKDVVKTLVYELCRHRNERARRRRGCPRRSPSRCSTSRRPPSCAPTSATTTACRPTTSSTRCSRPTWRRTAPSTSSSPRASTAALVERVAALVDAAEYKRRQMAPGVRITAKSFGKDRRLPITNRYGRRRRAVSEPAAPTPEDEWTAAHCRVLERLFATCGRAGARAAEEGRVDAALVLTSLAGQFAWHAELLFDLLPTRAGTDATRSSPAAFPEPTTRSTRSTSWRATRGPARHASRLPASWYLGCS